MSKLVEVTPISGGRHIFLRKEDIPGYLHHDSGRKKPATSPVSGLFLPNESSGILRLQAADSLRDLPEGFRFWPMNHMTLVSHSPLNGQGLLKVYENLLEATSGLKTYELKFSGYNVVRNNKSGVEDFVFLEIAEPEPLVEAKARLVGMLEPEGLVISGPEDRRDRWHITVGSFPSVPSYDYAEVSKLVEGALPPEELIAFFPGISITKRMRQGGKHVEQADRIFSPAFKK